MPNRREFFQRAAVGSALFGVPMARAEQALGRESPPLPSPKLYDSDPNRYWAELRRQWLLAADHINLNCGAVSCTPLPVLNAMIDHILSAEEYREPGYPWFGYEESSRLRELRDAMAAYLHCNRDELAIVRNTTEGNNVVCNGLDLKAGDEVLLTDQEHPGGRCPWEQKAQRFGLKLNYVNLPRPPKSVDEFVDAFTKALTPRTKVMVFSYITTTTGLILPVKELCKLARERDIITHVDGAHAVGQIPVDLHDLGCDYLATSTHKWLCAPKGTGLLYVRDGMADRLWVNIASSSWNARNLKAYRFSNVGTSNLSVMVGLKAALDFQKMLGPERVFKRIHELATRVRDHVAKYPQVKLLNASADPFYGSLVSFEPTQGDFTRLQEEFAARNIRVAGSARRIRVATHVFTQPTELNAFFDALDRGLQA